MDNNIKILVVEDDKNLGQSLSIYLEEEGYTCYLAHNIEKALVLFQLKKPDIALIDLGLPDGSGLDLGKELFLQNPKLKLMILSAQSDPETRVLGLELGAFDYIIKPFKLKELKLRLELIGKTHLKKEHFPQTITFGDVKIFFTQFRLEDPHGQMMQLTYKECSILKLLYMHINQVVSRDEIISSIWGDNVFPSNRTVDNYIVKLRKWCQDSKYLRISSIRGLGYKLELQGESHGIV